VTKDPLEIPAGEIWLKKPYRGSGGRGIRVYVAPETAPSQLPPDSTFYYQKQVVGRSASAVYLAAEGGSVLAGVTEQFVGMSWTRAAGCQYSGSLGPLRIDPDFLEQFERIGEVLAAEFGLTGLFGVDAVCDGSTVWPVEVNPRWTASVEVLERALGFSAVAWHVAACLERRLPARISADSAPWCGKAILFADKNLVVPDRFIRYAEDELLKPGWPNLADIPAAGTAIRTGGPITTVLAEADNSAAVNELLRHRAKEVRQALELC
jgi:predicted ATP-grasp superfamily ATP-dependent carboligase